MITIVERKVNLHFPLGHHQHCMIAQIPNHLSPGETGHLVTDPEGQWRLIQSILDLVAEGEGNLKKLHFLMFPESTLPESHLATFLEKIDQTFRPNTVTMIGIEHIPLHRYRSLLDAYREDNAEAVGLVDRDIDSGDVLSMPVNGCCIAVKEETGRLRVFLEAKSHPFRGEEFLDKQHDLYRGRHFYLFRSRPSCFTFMTLICLDYLYRDLYSSNIKQIIDHANRLWFTTRQGLDAIFVIQCNPKPEHRSYREVVQGFYGEYLEDFPGVRETTTIFGNSSEETVIDGSPDHGFGHSSVIISKRHKLALVTRPEYATDDFDGAPVCRLRFGGGTRLYYFNLPVPHELDPRTTRLPLKVHSIFARDGEWWTRLDDL
ncbi:MAG: hypothetical protein Fur0034_07390 [Desulfuromonadia bacterium]